MSVAVQDIVDESRIAVTRTISVAEAFISVVLLMVAAMALWFISRAAHYVTGNPAQVSAELESFNNGEGKLGVHKVFVQAGSGACGCKASIKEGACGHVDAALLTQQFLGRNSLGFRFTSVPEDTTGARGARGDSPRALGAWSPVLQARRPGVLRV